jgi:hypothetical protein
MVEELVSYLQVLIQYLQWYDGTEKDNAVSGFAKGVTGFFVNNSKHISAHNVPLTLAQYNMQWIVNRRIAGTFINSSFDGQTLVMSAKFDIYVFITRAYWSDINISGIKSLTDLPFG